MSSSVASIDAAWERDIGELLERTWGFQSGSRRLFRAAAVVLYETVLAVTHRGQSCCHVPRDPDPHDPRAFSWEERLHPELGNKCKGSACGKAAHRAGALLEKLGLLTIEYQHPRQLEPSRKPMRAYSTKKRTRAGGEYASGFYTPVRELRPTDRVLVYLGLLRVDVARAARILADQVAQVMAVASAPKGAAPRPNSGQIGPVQNPRQDQILETTVHRGGESRPPDTPAAVDFTALRDLARKLEQ